MYMNKWATFAAALGIQVSSGLFYCFGIFGPILKRAFNLDQSQTDTVGSALNLGGYCALLAGFAYQRLEHYHKLGPRLVIWAGCAANFVGYSTLYLGAAHGLPLSYMQVVCFSFLAGSGNNWWDTADLVTNIRNFPNEKGTVVGVMKAASGLSASAYTTIFWALFSTKDASFLAFLAVVPSVLVACLAMWVNHVPYVQRSEVRHFEGSFTHRKRFMLAYLLFGGLALYLLLGSTILQHYLVSRPARFVLVCIMVLLLSFLSLIPIGSGGCASQPADMEYMPQGPAKFTCVLSRHQRGRGKGAIAVARLPGGLPAPNSSAFTAASADSLPAGATDASPASTAHTSPAANPGVAAVPDSIRNKSGLMPAGLTAPPLVVSYDTTWQDQVASATDGLAKATQLFSTAPTEYQLAMAPAGPLTVALLPPKPNEEITGMESVHPRHIAALHGLPAWKVSASSAKGQAASTPNTGSGTPQQVEALCSAYPGQQQLQGQVNFQQALCTDEMPEHEQRGGIVSGPICRTQLRKPETQQQQLAASDSVLLVPDAMCLDMRADSGPTSFAEAAMLSTPACVTDALVVEEEERRMWCASGGQTQQHSCQQLNMPLLLGNRATSTGPELVQVYSEHAIPDLKLQQMLTRLEFHLLFVIFLLGTGSGLVFINNISQLLASLNIKASRASSYLSTFSVASAAGRMSFGFFTERQLHAQGIPRTAFLLLSSLLALAKNMLCWRAADSGTLYAAALVGGLAFGSYWVLTPTIASELFGLEHFAAAWTYVLQMAPVLGGFMLATGVAGAVYDRALHRQGHAHTCRGPDCFQPTFALLVCTSTLNMALTLCLWLRTRRVYARIVAHLHAVDRFVEEEEEWATETATQLEGGGRG